MLRVLVNAKHIQTRVIVHQTRLASSSTGGGGSPSKANQTGVYAPDVPRSDPTSPPPHASNPSAEPSTKKYTSGFKGNHEPSGRLSSAFPSESLDALYAKKGDASAEGLRPIKKGEEASTSPEGAHPATTSKVQHTDESAVGSSSAVRHGDAPGEMGKVGGSHGATGIQDEGAVVRNKEGSKLADVNPGPTAEQGRMGLDEAWKHRK